MRWSKKQFAVEAMIDSCFTFQSHRCRVCGDVLWLERMYRLPNGSRVCKSCCATKEEVYDLFFPEVATAASVIERKYQQQLVKEKEKLSFAIDGLKRIISQAVNADMDWDPDKDRFITDAVVAAENTLREIDGC